MDRSTLLFVCGVVLVVVEMSFMLTLPNPDDYARKGLGLGSAVGIGLCVYSGVYGRRARRADPRDQDGDA